MGYIGNSVVGVEHPSTSALNATTGDFTGAVDIDGAITSSTGATITTADNNPQITLTSTDTDANSGPRLDFIRNPGQAGADNDFLSAILHRGYNDAGTPELITYAEANVQILDASDGSEDARFYINTMVEGSGRSRLNILPSETVFNEDSVDVDFRVESNGNANMLVVDAGNDRIGLGTGSPSVALHQVAAAPRFIMQAAASMTSGNRVDIDAANSDGSTVGLIRFGAVSDNVDTNIQFYTRPTSGSLAEVMRIHHDAKISIGRTSTIACSFIAHQYDSGSAVGLNLASTDSSGGSQNQVIFTRNDSTVGTISTTGSNTAYGTSSDYRLKENVNYTWDATSRLKQLKPARFNFIIDADTTVDGFLAHEVSGIVPESVIGTKDETRNVTNAVLSSSGKVLDENITQDNWTAGKLATKDAEGNTVDAIYPSNSTWTANHTEPVIQSIDQSKLVPLLVKTLQEAVIKIETLEAKVTALENA